MENCYPASKHFHLLQMYFENNIRLTIVIVPLGRSSSDSQRDDLAISSGFHCLDLIL